MSIPPGQEIGEENQEDIDQTLFIVAGQGEAVLDGNITTVRQHDAVFVPAGTNAQPQEQGKRSSETVHSVLTMQNVLHFLTQRVVEEWRPDARRKHRLDANQDLTFCGR